STGNIVSWLWNFGDGDTDTVQNPVHTYDSVGIYTVRLIVSNDICSDTVTAIIIVENTTGIGAYLSKNIKIYPNPATGILFIDHKNADVFSIKIYNLLGKCIAKFNKNNFVSLSPSLLNIDLSDQTNGIYFVEIITNTGLLIKKFIIAKE
ncbi:MAG: T9SS type A sorting domain-containing protein, partial [Bacteroidetes bacterium]|nr:T9SS type A sorting domain-containing protein [Bacteroidota bacterium]